MFKARNIKDKRIYQILDTYYSIETNSTFFLIWEYNQWYWAPAYLFQPPELPESCNIYFDNFDNYYKLKDKYICISYVSPAPDFFKGKIINELFPSKEMISYYNGLEDEEFYKFYYNNILLKISFDVFYGKLQMLSNLNENKDIILFCHNTHNNLRYENVLMAWFKKHHVTNDLKLDL